MYSAIFSALGHSSRRGAERDRLRRFLLNSPPHYAHPGPREEGHDDPWHSQGRSVLLCPWKGVSSPSSFSCLLQASETD